MDEATEMTFEWACPRCGAVPNEHGKGGMCHMQADQGCLGFICECDGDQLENHGITLSDPCREAHCEHCDWFGTFPKKPKLLMSWEAKALDAGWTMPKSRIKELILAEKKMPHK